MRHLPTILRQVRRSFRQSGLFVLCVALSLTTLTAFSGFSRSVGRALLDDARTLHAADIIIRSYDPIPPPPAAGHWPAGGSAANRTGQRSRILQRGACAG
jgi:predicted lysophospholipase L1 biosynthesis ABC-type transport system permease subunit